MKRSFALLLTALMLSFSLAACGQDQQTNDNGAGTGGVTGGDVAGSGTNGTNASVNGGNDVNGSSGPVAGSGSTGSVAGDIGDDIQNGLDNAGDAIENGMDDLTDGTAGTARARVGGASYEQMVRNGQVHDRDGDLTDFENAVTPGSAF